MLLSEYVSLNWNSKIKKHYVNLGYTFTKMKDSFQVRVDDLTDGSGVNVDVKCDYCGKEYKKIWNHYIRENRESEIHKDCCNDCKKLKIVETSESKYGVSSVFLLDDVQKKIIETNLKKYGSENPFQSEEIKTKIAQSNISKYGVSSPMKLKQIVAKVSATCQERYGVPFYICTQIKKGEQNPRWKGGVAYHRQERATSDYIEWRKAVFQRDKYTCQCCNSRNGNGHTINLHAHHIRNWKDNPNSRYDIDNGVTLCDVCHYKFHSIFGKYNNDEIQLENFFINQDKKIC